MKVMYAVVALGVIVDQNYEQASCTTQENSNLASPTSKINAVHCKPIEDREGPMTQHKIAESKDFQRLSQNWRQKVYISDAYSK